MRILSDFDVIIKGCVNSSGDLFAKEFFLKVYAAEYRRVVRAEGEISWLFFYNAQEKGNENQLLASFVYDGEAVLRGCGHRING